MKIAVPFVMIMLVSACTKPAAIDQFNHFLGEEKTEALDQMVVSYDLFLEVNYPDKSSDQDRAVDFLQSLEEGLNDFPWTFETDKNREILAAIETSGTRQEIWLYGYEDGSRMHCFLQDIIDGKKANTADSIPLGDLEIELEEEVVFPPELAARMKEEEEAAQRRWDSTLHVNLCGRFWEGIARFAAPEDSVYRDYLLVRDQANNLSPAIIVNGFLNYPDRVADPFFKRMIIVELYYFLVREDIHRKDALLTD